MQGFLFVKTGNFYFKLKYCEIIYIQAEKKYVAIATQNNVYLSLVSISNIEKLLPKDLFCRVHRSYIISLEHIHKFDNEIAYVGNRKIPIAKHFKEILKDSITIVKGEVKCIELANTDTDKMLRNANSQ
jgi:DNA-binding LytR/AlgR family response regulator